VLPHKSQGNVVVDNGFFVLWSLVSFGNLFL
jgi:hypothetical protein